MPFRQRHHALEDPPVGIPEEPPSVEDGRLDLRVPPTALGARERLERHGAIHRPLLEHVTGAAVASVPLVGVDLPWQRALALDAAALGPNLHDAAPEDQSVAHDGRRVLLVDPLAVELAL